jgi:hypothetical protein
MILSALLLFAVAVEVFLFVGKDHLLDTRRRAALEASLRQVYTDLQEAKKRIETKRADMLQAVEEGERQRAELQDAARAFAAAQKIMPTLVHTLGEPNTGTRFRALLTKHLPATPEDSQKLIWSCKNYVDVWAGDAATARQTAERQFQIKQDYDIGEFTAMPSQPPAPLREEAA